LTIIEKPWGKEEILIETVYYRIKKITVNPGCRTSLQYHNKKVETIIYPDGRIKHIPPKRIHRIIGPVTVIEVSHGSDDDVIRLEDDYGRIVRKDKNITKESSRVE